MYKMQTGILVHIQVKLTYGVPRWKHFVSLMYLCTMRRCDWFVPHADTNYSDKKLTLKINSRPWIVDKATSVQRRRRPCTLSIHRRPCTLGIHRRPWTLSIHRRPCTLSIHRRPWTLSIHRRPFILSIHRRPYTLGIHRRPCTLGIHRRPCTLSIHRRPCILLMQ
jgi:hypothetical protein